MRFNPSPLPETFGGGIATQFCRRQARNRATRVRKRAACAGLLARGRVGCGAGASGAPAERVLSVGVAAPAAALAAGVAGTVDVEVVVVVVVDVPKPGRRNARTRRQAAPRVRPGRLSVCADRGWLDLTSLLRKRK